MPSWNHPAQSFKGHRLLQERHQDVPPESLEHQKIRHIGGCTFSPSGTGQDFHGKSMQKYGLVIS